MSRIQRTKAADIASLVREYLNITGMVSGINSSCIFSAWNKVSGAGQYTARKFFKDGTLFLTMTSSVIANQLFFQKEDIRKKINEILDADVLFQGNRNPEKKIVIK